MASVTGIEDDLERGSQHEDVKHGKPVSIAVEAIGTEINAQLQDIQRELDEFLAQHVNRIGSLQKLIRDAGERRKSGTRASFPDEVRSVGNVAIYHQDPLVPDSNIDFGLGGGGGGTKTLLNTHTQHVEQFLLVHMENVQKLRESLGKNEIGSVGPDRRAGPTDGNQCNSKVQEFWVSVAISTLNAILIVAFLALVNGIIGPDRHRVPYSAGMLFCFFSLGLHFLCIVLAFVGAMLASQGDSQLNDPSKSGKVDQCLSLGRQLQFAANVIFLLPFILLSFYMFSGIVFPVIHLVFLLVASVIVVGLVVYQLPTLLRLDNLSSVVTNVRHRQPPIQTLRPQAAVMPPAVRPRRSVVTVASEPRSFTYT